MVDRESASGAVTNLHALLDPALAPSLWPMLVALARVGAARCLFEGDLAPMLARVSPYIVDIARAPNLMERWRSEGTGQHWGSIIGSKQSMQAVRRHVRRFMQVKLPDGTGPVLLRLWDPRVLRVLLETADADQFGRLTAGIDGFWGEHEGGFLPLHPRFANSTRDGAPC